MEAPGVERGSGENAGECRSAQESGFGGGIGRLRGRGGEGERAGEGAESHACSNVASGPTRAELLALVDAAIIALDAGDSGIARAQLQALAEAVRAKSHARDLHGV